MGCVLGAFVGDAAGATLEFISYSKINKASVQKALKL
jgi:ADP-ribosylglycohydrolase